MQTWAKTKQSGFTIVELLIVIIVIGILATLILVAYNGVNTQANTSVLKNDLEQVAKQLNTLKESAGGGTTYPTDSSNLSYSTNTYLQYTYDNTASPATYCVTASNTVANLNFYVSNTSQTPTTGICPGQNTIIWDKVRLLNTSMPATGAAVDTSTYRTSVASMKLAPGVTVALRGTPFSDPTGTLYKSSFWVKSDSSWNGTGNSKLRFSNPADGSLLGACSYNGVKLTWTQVTCSLTTSTAQVNATLANDGSTGNVWIDDFTFSKQ